MSSSPFHVLEQFPQFSEIEERSLYSYECGLDVKSEPISPVPACVDEGKTYTELIPPVRGDTCRLLSTRSSTSDYYETDFSSDTSLPSSRSPGMPGHALYPAMEAETDTDLRAWVNKHPNNWTSHEVLDWVYYVAAQMGCDGREIEGEKFNDLKGATLMRMTRVDFKRLEPICGELLYDTFQDIMKKSQYEPPDGLVSDAMMNAFSHESLPSIRNFLGAKHEEMEFSGYNREEDKTAILNEFIEENLQLPLGQLPEMVSASLGGILYEIDGTETFDGICLPHGDLVESGYDTESDETMSSASGPLPKMPGLIPVPVGEVGLMSGPDPATCGPASPGGAGGKIPGKQPRRGPGRPRKERPNGETPTTARSPRGRKPGQSTKGNHLWEFVRDMLKDPKFNPKVIKWEDEEDRVFRIVQSEQVAKMWGDKKNNPNMTYEKLSRALRFCRSQGHFADVPKTGRFPKKLCFKFGPKAVI